MYYIVVFMAPIPTSHYHLYQFRKQEPNNFLEVIKNSLPISMQDWWSVVNVHLENYRREAQNAELLHRKMHEVCRGTGPTGEPNSPSYVIKAKQINRQLAEMIDALSGGSVACPMALILMAQGPVSLPMSLTAKPL